MPLLAVEVLSPSTRRHDLVLTREVYAAGGVASYWVCDPDEPSVTVPELADGAYAQVARTVGAERIEVTAPYVVTLVPTDLLRGGLCDPADTPS